MEKEWLTIREEQREMVFHNLQEAEHSAINGTKDIRFREESGHYVADGKGIQLVVAEYSSIDSSLCSVDILCLDEAVNEDNNQNKHLITTLFNKDKDFFWHRHEFYEVMYVTHGVVEERLYDKVLQINEQEVLIMNPNVEHTEQFAGNATLVYLWIPKEDIAKILDESILTESTKDFFEIQDGKVQKMEYLHYTPLQPKEISNLIDQLFEERSFYRPGSKYIIYGLISRLLSQLDNNINFRKIAVSREVSNSFSLFLKIEKYLEKNRWNIEKDILAKKFYYSEQHLNKVMKMYTGKSISKYCIDHKIAMAEQLLKKTDMSINDIIQYLGYENKTYFYRIFRQKNGMTPQKYRQI